MERSIKEPFNLDLTKTQFFDWMDPHSPMSKSFFATKVGLTRGMKASLCMGRLAHLLSSRSLRGSALHTYASARRLKPRTNSLVPHRLLFTSDLCSSVVKLAGLPLDSLFDRSPCSFLGCFGFGIYCNPAQSSAPMILECILSR